MGTCQTLSRAGAKFEQLAEYPRRDGGYRVYLEVRRRNRAAECIGETEQAVSDEDVSDHRNLAGHSIYGAGGDDRTGDVESTIRFADQAVCGRAHLDTTNGRILDANEPTIGRERQSEPRERHPVAP